MGDRDSSFLVLKCTFQYCNHLLKCGFNSWVPPMCTLVVHSASSPVRVDNYMQDVGVGRSQLTGQSLVVWCDQLTPNSNVLFSYMKNVTVDMPQTCQIITKLSLSWYGMYKLANRTRERREGENVQPPRVVRGRVSSPPE